MRYETNPHRNIEASQKSSVNYKFIAIIFLVCDVLLVGGLLLGLANKEDHGLKVDHGLED